MTRRALLAAWVLLSLCLPAWAKDDLVIGVSQFPSTMNPDINPAQVTNYILGFALRGMAGFGPDWKNACQMCVELPSFQNGLARMEGSGMAVTLKIRDDQFWADGVPVTTADLAFVVKLGKDPKSGFADTRYFDNIASMETIDAHTAVLHLVKPDPMYDRLIGVLPAHIEEPVYDPVAGTGQYMGVSVYNRAPTTPGLYNGPYRITQFTQGQTIVLEPNPYWRGHAPAIKRIVIKGIDNTPALEANLLSGDIDMAPGDGPALSIDQVLALRKQSPNRFTYIFQPSLTYEHVDLNLDNPLLQDVRVRRALLLAIDRKTMVAKLFGGMQAVADGFVEPLDPVHVRGLRQYPFDPAQAKALLDAAGWKPGSDGIRVNAKGQRLSMDFGTTAGDRLRELVQTVLQSEWKQVGVETTIRNAPARSFFGQIMAHREFGGMAMYAWLSPISAVPRQTLDSSQIPNEANNWGGGNYPGFRNATVDHDIEIIAYDMNPEHRAAAWSEVQHIYADQLPSLPLFFRVEPYVLPKWLHGVTPTGHTDSSSEWAENWTIK